MVAKKRKSKRQTLQIKYKIQKRTKQHEKKIKKGMIKKKRMIKADTGIPSAWPYKEELLQEIQAAKDKMERIKEEQKNKRAVELDKRRKLNQTIGESVKESVDDDEMDEENGASLANNNNTRANKDGSIDMISRDGGMNSRRAFLKELRKVVDNSDVVLHVLDARDPLGTRSNAIEEMVLSNYKKKLVYVLNKADLVPRDVLVQWLAFLRKSHPTLLFKCNTQQQNNNLGRMSGKISKLEEDAIHNTSHAIGTEELLNILKNYARSDGSGGSNKALISVGIVGFPNVGKSSLINSLLRVRKVGVSSVPGFTRQYQEVILDKNIRLIDCPGIVFAEESESQNNAAAALRNCVNVDELTDVYAPIQAILERCPQSYLMQLYNIPRFPEGDAMAFLSLVAKNTGKLKKGGIPNTDMAARTVLHEWNTGKIKYYCKLPTDAEGKVIMDPAVVGNGNKGGTTITAEEAAAADSEARILTKMTKKSFDLGKANISSARNASSASSGEEMDEEDGCGNAEDARLLGELDSDELCDYIAIDGADGAASAPVAESTGSKKKGKKGAATSEYGVMVGKSGKSAEDVVVDRKIKNIKQTTLDKLAGGDDTGFSAATVMNRSIMKSSSSMSGTVADTTVVKASLRSRQKEEKKKASKDSRRAATSGGSYDFDTDFQYDN